MITTSVFTPESGTIEHFGSPRLRAIPPTVRRYVDPLKSSAASTIACSGFDSRRRIGSAITGSSAPARFGSKIAASLSRRRRRSGAAAGVVGEPSFTQPCWIATSLQSGQTST